MDNDNYYDIAIIGGGISSFVFVSTHIKNGFNGRIAIIENIPILPLIKPWKVRPVLGINSYAKFIILNIFYFLWLISSLSWAASS